MPESRLFISYSHRDKDWLTLLQTQFAILAQQGQVTAWSDEHIRAGDSWNAEIQEAMVQADVAVLLVTGDFNLNHWDFRVLFRSLLKEEGRGRRSETTHVAVQIVPDDDQVTEPERAREYLEKYFERFSDGNVSIY